MSGTTFSIFLDEGISCQTISHSTSVSSRKSKAPSNSSTPATKENVNPLTGLAFDSQPPLKKRKPSSSSALKAKPLPSKIASKSKKLLSSGNSKEKGKKRAVLGASGDRNTADHPNSSETDQLQTALGNRRAYEFTVMPLANVTQAYDEGEATRATSQANICTLGADLSSETMAIDEAEATEKVRFI